MTCKKKKKKKNLRINTVELKLEKNQPIHDLLERNHTGLRQKALRCFSADEFR